MCVSAYPAEFLAMEGAEAVSNLHFYEDCQFAFPKVAPIISLLILNATSVQTKIFLKNGTKIVIMNVKLSGLFQPEKQTDNL